MRQPATVSRELVEDLHLKRWARQVNAWGDWFHIDRRRLRRELRKLPKLRRAANARFRHQVMEIYGTRPKAIILDDVQDGEPTPAAKAAALAWFEETFAGRLPAAGMLRQTPKR